MTEDVVHVSRLGASAFTESHVAVLSELVTKNFSNDFVLSFKQVIALMCEL